jgi:hypothetical protein
MVPFITSPMSAEAEAATCQPGTAHTGPGCSARRSSDGQTIIVMITAGQNHGLDLRFWVELRGFEPLTPSMRTKFPGFIRAGSPVLRQKDSAFALMGSS